MSAGTRATRESRDMDATNPIPGERIDERQPGEPLRPAFSSRAMFRAVLSYGGFLAAVAVCTWLGFRLHFTPASIGFVYLILVVFAAAYGGFRRATVTSIAAVTCLDYFFFPPILSFTISDPQNWLALGAFEFTALIVSRLSYRAQVRAAEAIAGQRDSERLYEISRQILLLDRSRDPGALIPTLIRESFELRAVVLFDAVSANTHGSGNCSEEDKQGARHAYFVNSDRFGPEKSTCCCALRLGARPVGGLALSGRKFTPVVAHALASVCAIAMERARSFEQEYSAEAARQLEQLRAAVLDALAHEIKTPLTVITTASSGLLAAGALSETQTDLVALIDDQAKELTDLASRLLGAARLDRADFKPRREAVFLSNLVKDTIGDVEDPESRSRVHISVPDHETPVLADRKLMGSAFAQILDNAIKYSKPGSPIDVELAVAVPEVIVAVRDHGLVIAPADRQRIFERFYRAPGVEQGPAGTGLGLSIVRRVVDAHNGRVWAESSPEHGTAFYIALPVAEELH